MMKKNHSNNYCKYEFFILIGFVIDRVVSSKTSQMTREKSHTAIELLIRTQTQAVARRTRVDTNAIIFVNRQNTQ